MSNTANLLAQLHQRVVELRVTTIAAIHALEQDQADAVLGAQDASGGSTSRSGHSDPTPGLAARLGPYRARERQISSAVRAVLNAVAEAERIVAASTFAEPVELTDDDRCPGWNLALTTRLGGCGKVREEYRRGDGTTGERPLCVGCRSALTRARRRGRDMGMCETHLEEYVNDHGAKGEQPMVNYWVLERCEACGGVESDSTLGAA